MKLFDIFKKKEVPKYGTDNWVLVSGDGQYKNDNDYVGWVFACIRAIIEKVAEIDLYLYRYDKQGKKEIVMSHPAIDLLYAPSRYFSKYDIFEYTQGFMELYGNAYWFVERDRRGQPVEIFLLHPNNMKVVASKENYVDHYLYTLDGKQQKLYPQNIIHFKTFNPKSFIYGVSTISAVRATANSDASSKKYNEKFYENGAVPLAALTTPHVMNEAEQKRTLAAWNSAYMGVQNAFKTAFLQNGIDFKTFNIPHTDQQYIEQRILNRDEILAIFRVPKIILGITEDVNYASAKASNYVFTLHNIQPKCQRIVDVLTKSFLPMFGTDDLEFGFRSPVQEDRNEEVNYYSSGRLNGYLSPNDIRRAEGLPELEGGESVLVDGVMLQPKKSQKDIPMTSIIAKNLAQSLLEAEKSKKEKSIERKAAEKINEISARTNPYFLLIQQASEKLFYDQKKKAIAKLERIYAKSIKQQVPELLNHDEEVDNTYKLFLPIFTAMTFAEFQQALKELGLNPADYIISTTVDKFVVVNGKRFAAVVTDTTMQSIRAELVAGIEQGESVYELTKRLNENFAFSKSRAERIARTESIRGTAKAELEAWKLSGVVKQVQWVVAPGCDHSVCLDLDGKIIDLGGEFLSLDEMKNLDISDYDGSIKNPPVHPNCKCVLIPLVG